MERLSAMRLFVEVARAKSFRKAAEVLDMPNSTVSRHIAGLEKTIGVRLLHRSTRKVELTEEGALYFARCQGLVEEALMAHEALRDVAQRPSGTLRISMPVDLAVGTLAPILSDFAVAYPSIGFEFDVTPRRVDLQADPFDLAIRIGPPPTAPSTLVARQIALLPRYLYAAPSYLKTAPRLVRPSDLAQHTLCVGQATAKAQDEVRRLYRGSEVVDVVVGTRFAMNSVGLSRALATRGVAIAVLDPDLAREDIQAGRLRRVLPQWHLAPVQVHAITETRLLPARTRVFIEFLKARLEVDALDASRPTRSAKP